MSPESMSLNCPACKALLYSYGFQLEGELQEPAPHESFHCQRCGWQGAFADLSKPTSSFETAAGGQPSLPHSEAQAKQGTQVTWTGGPVLDFQI